MSELIGISVDVSSAQEYLRETALKIPQIEKKVLRLVGKEAAKETNKAVKSTLDTSTKAIIGHRYTYNMNKMYTYGKAKDHSLTVYPKAVAGGTLIIPVSTTLNYGYDAGAKRGPHVTGRGFVQMGESYVKTGRYMPEVQKLVDKELEKYNRKFEG